MNEFGDRVAVGRIVDRGLEVFFPSEFAEARVEGIPSGDGARDGYAVDASLGHAGRVFRFDVGDGQCLRGPAAGVESVELAGFCFPVNREQIAADAVHHGLGDAEDRVGRDGGVYGGASLGQDLRAGDRSLHVTGGDDAVAGQDHGTGVGAVLGEGGDRGEEE